MAGPLQRELAKNPSLEINAASDAMRPTRIALTSMKLTHTRVQQRANIALSLRRARVSLALTDPLMRLAFREVRFRRGERDLFRFSSE
jgi:hypothetical protein